jgi:hypothetical protein
VQGSCALQVSSAHRLVPTSPCKLVVPGMFLQVPASSEANLWLDNLDIHVQQTSPPMAQVGKHLNVITADMASLFLTNMQLTGSANSSAAVDLTDSSMYITGTLRQFARIGTLPACATLPCAIMPGQ